MIDITTYTKTDEGKDGWHIEVHIKGDTDIVNAVVAMIKNMVRALDYMKEKENKNEMD